MILKIIIGIIFLALGIVDFKQGKNSEAIVLLCGVMVYAVVNIMQVITK